MFCRIFFWLNWVCRSIRSANEVLISFRLSVNLLAVSVSISLLPTLSFISLKTFLSKSSNVARAAFAAETRILPSRNFLIVSWAKSIEAEAEFSVATIFWGALRFWTLFVRRYMMRQQRKHRQSRLPN